MQGFGDLEEGIAFLNDQGLEDVDCVLFEQVFNGGVELFGEGNGFGEGDMDKGKGIVHGKKLLWVEEAYTDGVCVRIDRRLGRDSCSAKLVVFVGDGIES